MIFKSKSLYAITAYLKKKLLITGCKPESAFPHLAFILLCETNL